MIILSLRTDKPEAELGLYDDDSQLAYEVWTAHRELAETIHVKINGLLGKQGKSLRDIGGIVCYQGPGSFTGLRIGLSVANALAYGLGVPIVGVTGETDWLEKGRASVLTGNDTGAAMPEYGAPVHITASKK